MKQHVHLRDGPDGAIELLAEQVGLAAVLAVLVDVFLGRDQHTARATAGVVDIVGQGRLEQMHHQPHHRARRIELAAFLAGRVGELGDQVLVGGAQQVGEFEVAVAQAHFTEVGDELAQLLIGNLALADLAGEVDVLQHPFQGRVIFLDASQCLVQQVTDVDVCFVEQIPEARMTGHPETAIALVPAWVLRRDKSLGSAFASAHLLSHDLLVALLEYVGAALEKQHAEDVFLELRCIHLAAQNVGGLEQVAFQLLQREGHCGIPCGHPWRVPILMA
ncbi:hypothetical protein D9M70_503790 [compost metagenome]